jgi:hypothetical protein
MTTRLYILLIAISTLIFSGCSHFDELNQDPHRSTDMHPQLIIPTVQLQMGGYWHSQFRLFIYPGGFMNQFTGPWAMEFGMFGEKNSAYSEYLWNTFYSGGLIRNVVDVVERTRDNADMVNANAMARVMRVQAFMKLTDYYGDIPYSQAAMGYFTGILNPKYDRQEDIYHDFLKELKEAAESFNTNAAIPNTDFYFNGDVEKWRRFANSLRLRAAMRLVKVDPALAQREALAAVAAGVMQSNDDIAFVKYENILNGNENLDRGNPLSNFFMQADPTAGALPWLGDDFVRAMENTNDPRIRFFGGVFLQDREHTDVTAQVRAIRGSYSAMAVPSQAEGWRANPLYPAANAPVTVTVGGEEHTIALAWSRLRPSKPVTAFDAPLIHLSYAEVEFLQAEMAVRGWQPSAADHYRKGLEAAVMQWNLYGANVLQATAMAFSAANTLTPGQELNQINTQLWILHALDPIESWSNYRRSGFPELEFHLWMPDRNETGGKRPRRMQYPLEEQMRNPINLKEAVDRMGSDDWMNSVWWDK